MSTACCAPVAPAAGWAAAASRERRLRGSLVFIAAAALHLGAAALFVSGASAPHGKSRGAPAPIAVLWLFPEQAQAPARSPVAPAKAAALGPKIQPRAAVLVEAPASIAEPQQQPNRARGEDTTPSATPAQPEPVYAVARRSLAFGGATATRDDTAASGGGKRPLAGWLQEGIARSVWPVAHLLAAGGDGVCRATRDDPRLVCSEAPLDALVTQVPLEDQASLLSWVRSGLAKEIEIRVDAGSATYVVR